MKLSLALILSLVMANAMAQDSRTYTKVSSSKAIVTINTPDEDSVQAAIYLDGAENEKFIQDLLKDKNSELAKLKAKLELENCGEVSTDDNAWIDGCGEVHISDAVNTDFGRSGWMGGFSGYSFFVGFRSDGTGRFLSSNHLVQIFESTEALVDTEGEYTKTVEKTLSLGKIIELPSSDQ